MQGLGMVLGLYFGYVFTDYSLSIFQAGKINVRGGQCVIAFSC